MEILKFQHENVRILASRELRKFGLNLSLPRLPGKKPNIKGRCYGVPLQDLEKVPVEIRGETVTVPKVFRDLVAYIDQNIFEEGLFRKEGSKAKVRTLVRILDNGYEIPDGIPVHEACAATKVLLNSIPGHLIPSNLTRWFIEACNLEEHATIALNLCILLLPLDNLYLLVFLMQFFNDVTKQEAHNKMTSYNLAVVIGPNIFAQAIGTSLIAMNKAVNAILNITNILIEQAPSLGIVPDAILRHLDELLEERNVKRNCCAWYVPLTPQKPPDIHSRNIYYYYSYFFK